jgi:hypothetical protein
VQALQQRNFLRTGFALQQMQLQILADGIREAARVYAEGNDLLDSDMMEQTRAVPGGEEVTDGQDTLAQPARLVTAGKAMPQMLGHLQPIGLGQGSLHVGDQHLRNGLVFTGHHD